MATTLEIVTALQQAAANCYDGSHDERFTGKDLAKEIGLRREKGCSIKDSRVIDGFSVKVSGNTVFLSYHTECTSKEAHRTSLVSEIEQCMADIVKFLKKEYKKVGGEGSLSLNRPSEVDIEMQYISRQRVSIIASQKFELGGVEAEHVGLPSEEDRLDKSIRDFLSMGREDAKKPSNYTAKNES
tara:strand:+ start:854 stop:1408 length:555 start_codon:yes stop_codon:yes gene_type:complete